MKRDGFRRTWEKVLPCGSLCESISPILRDHSEWPQVKRTEDELLRHECLKLFDEGCHFQPDWIHTEMRQRQAARADAAQWLTPRRCRMRLRGRDGSELTCGFSARVVAIGKNGIHAVMRTARVLTACVASDRVGRDTCSETWDTCSDARSVMQFPEA